MNSRPRTSALLGPLVLAGSFLAGPGRAAAPPGQAAAAPSVIGLDEISVGQRGYGISVFRGSEPERFEVEVVGVLRNLSPATSFIITRLSGQGLESSGVVQGMSGSPVYIEGRLAGAVAFGWAFSKEAIAGITPIAEMRQLASDPTGLPAGSPLQPGPGATASGAEAPEPQPAASWRQVLAAAAEPTATRLETALAALRPRLAGGGLPAGAASGIQFSAAGFGSGTTALLDRALGGVTPAGRARPASGDGQASTAEALAPGRMLAVVLVDGDLQLAASGTVTDRLGDKVLAFGHALLGSGPVSLPMATAEVVTVMSSANTSFKLSNVGEIVGAVTQDRRVGLLGRLGAEAPMIPVHLRVEAARERDFTVRIAEVPGFTAGLLSSALLGSLEMTSWRAGAMGLDLEARFVLPDYGDLEVRQSFDGDNAASESVGYLLTIAGFLLDNDFEKVKVDAIEVSLRQAPSPRKATLVNAFVSRPVAHPGETVELSFDLATYRGELLHRRLWLALPADLPAGKLQLLVGSGVDADTARLAAEPVSPLDFRQALELVRGFHSRRKLVVLGLVPGAGLATAGQTLPRLPGSIRSLWGASGASAGLTPLRLAVATDFAMDFEAPLYGLARVDLQIERTAAAPPRPAVEPKRSEGKNGNGRSGRGSGRAASARPVGHGGGGNR